MICYKVFYVGPDGKIWSTNHIRNSSGLEQEYHLNQENTPAFKYPILAFRDFDSAKEYSNGSGRNLYGEKVAMVEGAISRNKIFWLLEINDSVFLEVQGKSIARFINKISQGRLQHPPFGTVGLSQLRILEFLEY